MQFSKLIKEGLNQGSSLALPGDFEVKGITTDSREVREGFVFLAIKGNSLDANEFISQALILGAKGIIAQRGDAQRGKIEGAQLLLVEDIRYAAARLSDCFYGHPSSRIKVVGITGTNGKTTVSYLLEALLKEKKLGSAVVGTVNYRFADTLIPAVNTTPGPIEIQKLLVRMQQERVRYLVMEVSSHALAQQRTAGIKFSSAIFTNLSEDHLDYHADMEDYFQAKNRLFSGISRDSFIVLNSDDRYSKRIADSSPAEATSYGIEEKADFSARDIKITLEGMQFTLVTPCGELPLETPLIGRHNLYNILAFAAWSIKEGFTLTDIAGVIKKFDSLPGRLQKVKNTRGLHIFVDYAHTEDALKNVIRSLRSAATGKIFVVFGCGGQRDKGKRPKMGRLVTELADFAVITSDNPRTEDPDSIIEDILKGVKKKNYSVVPQRQEAIKKSLSLASVGDIILVAGKGHETSQAFKDKSIHFDDHEVISECLISRN